MSAKIMSSNGKQKLTLVLLLILIAALACEGTPSALQILDQPVFVCPTATPRPTDTPIPTGVQPPMVVPPSGWATNTPIPGCIWNGSICATSVPYPGGHYTTPGYSIPGAISTPRPTTTPYPTPTPFVMRPPDDFYVGDSIYTGGFVSLANARLRLLNIQTRSASPASGNSRSIVVWQIEIKNEGVTLYEVFPAWQMFISTITTPDGDVDGLWGASLDAVREAGLTIDLDPTTLAPGQTQTFTLVAYIPAGTPKHFTWTLDPTTRPMPATPGVPGSNLLVWSNVQNTICTGRLAEPPVLPTPVS
ncbi:MAG: hypothetical protein ABI700_00280 [Chloroflexota bacterium]